MLLPRVVSSRNRARNASKNSEVRMGSDDARHRAKAALHPLRVARVSSDRRRSECTATGAALSSGLVSAVACGIESAAVEAMETLGRFSGLDAMP